MLTNRDREIQQQTGMVSPDRLRSMHYALTQERADAIAAAKALPDDAASTYAAAALRGKAKGYQEAAAMVAHILEGHALHARSWSSTRRRNREHAALRRLRKLANADD